MATPFTSRFPIGWEAVWTKVWISSTSFMRVPSVAITSRANLLYLPVQERSLLHLILKSALTKYALLHLCLYICFHNSYNVMYLKCCSVYHSSSMYTWKWNVLLFCVTCSNRYFNFVLPVVHIVVLWCCTCIVIFCYLLLPQQSSLLSRVRIMEQSTPQCTEEGRRGSGITTGRGEEWDSWSPSPSRPEEQGSHKAAW